MYTAIATYIKLSTASPGLTSPGNNSPCPRRTYTPCQGFPVALPPRSYCGFEYYRQHCQVVITEFSRYLVKSSFIVVTPMLSFLIDSTINSLSLLLPVLVSISVTPLRVWPELRPSLSTLITAGMSVSISLFTRHSLYSIIDSGSNSMAMLLPLTWRQVRCMVLEYSVIVCR